METIDQQSQQSQQRRRRVCGDVAPPASSTASAGSSGGTSCKAPNDVTATTQPPLAADGTTSHTTSSLSGHTHPHDDDHDAGKQSNQQMPRHAAKKRPLVPPIAVCAVGKRPGAGAGVGMAGNNGRVVTADSEDVAMIDNNNSKSSSAEEPDTDDGYAVGIDLEGSDGNMSDDYGGDAGERNGRSSMPQPPHPPVVDAVSDNSTSGTADAMMMDEVGGTDAGSGEASPTARPLSAHRRVQTTAPTYQQEQEDERARIHDVGSQASARSAPAELSNAQQETAPGDDPPETKSNDGESSSDQASICSASGRRRLRQELEVVEKERKQQQQQPSLSLPEPPIPVFPLQQLQANLLQSPRRESVLRSLSETMVRGSLTTINLSQRGLTARDANVIKLALLQNPHLTVLKLSYNSLDDEGAAIIASGIGQMAVATTAAGAPSKVVHHSSLSVLDLGFNCIGDAGCAAVSTLALAGNAKLRTLFLSGNNVRGPGAMALATAIAKGCGLTRLHLTANRIGIFGTRGLTIAIAEAEAKRQQIAAAAAAAEAAGGTIGKEFPEVPSMQELHLGGASMGSTGCLAVSNMALTNHSLRVLSLSDNGINDRDLALFSQSISRNKAIPLEKIQFSFNRLTCVGVESLMNAIWGSTTLKELRLDNNHIKDRGAQLAAVTLTSVKLKVLDLGFNKISTVGIKAIMKTLSENTSLEALILSGNPLDINASKAVSYALAYNRTLKEFFVDNCSVGYAAQRHIAAGIVSNSSLALRAITGFRLGSIAVTLGLPPALDKWSNEQTLKFIRFMWERRLREQRKQGEEGEVASSSEHYGDDGSTTTESSPVDSKGQAASKLAKPGPADPTLVVSAAKSAFEALGDSEGTLLLSDTPPRERLDSCPLVANDAVMLERSPSGNIRVPDFDETRKRRLSDEVTPLRRMIDKSPSSSAVKKDALDVDPERRKRLEEWLGQHITSLTELANLPFNDSDLWKLHQYFYSPVGTSIFKKSTDGPQILSDEADGKVEVKANLAPKKTGGLSRKVSFRHLGDAAATDLSGSLSSSPTQQRNGVNRRRLLDMVDTDGNDGCPATKRARSNKPRIDYYPRVKAKLETLRYQTNQNQTLVRLRQLKYVEGSMFQGRSVQSDPDPNPDGFTTADVEAILDML